MKELQLNCALVKRQYQKKDGSNGYALELYLPSVDKTVRILTYKDDSRGYYLLDASATYIGNPYASKQEAKVKEDK